MERLKAMSLKKSFFTISLLFLLAALLLSIFLFWACAVLVNTIEKPNYVSIEIGKNLDRYEAQYAEQTGGDWRIIVLTVLQMVLPVLFVILSLFLATVVFYRIKLKSPLAILQSSAERIIQNNLDFSITAESNDELGNLCTAFESMRLELLRNNRELWRQMEERKRLNAAFAHDLRNPVTVLKGSAQILQMGLENGNLTAARERDTVSLIGQYVRRIETYVEAMTGAQKLEEIRCNPIPLEWDVFSLELCESISILGKSAGFAIEFHNSAAKKRVWISKDTVYNVVENLVSNAMRYADKLIRVDLTCEHDQLIVSVTDDGPGFSQKVLSKGAEPFLRDEDTLEQTEHFGMGLYVCRLLCEKHSGLLTLKNTEKGAIATATFSISKP